VWIPPRWPRDTPLSAKLALNFADKWRSLSRYSSLADQGPWSLFFVWTKYLNTKSRVPSQDLRSLRRRQWRMPSSALISYGSCNNRCFGGTTVSIIRVKRISELGTMLAVTNSFHHEDRGDTFLWHGITSQKTAFFTTTILFIVYSTTLIQYRGYTDGGERWLRKDFHGSASCLSNRGCILEFALCAWGNPRKTQNTRCTDRDSNQARPEYKSRSLAVYTSNLVQYCYCSRVMGHCYVHVPLAITAVAWSKLQFPQDDYQFLACESCATWNPLTLISSFSLSTT
jgi:hypothetical protein